MTDTEEVHTIESTLDILRSWSWLYEGLERRDDVNTDEQVAAGAARNRNRQCSIGWHEECSDRSGINWNGDCNCPCHQASWEHLGLFMRWMDECLTALTTEPEKEPWSPPKRGGEDNPITKLTQCFCGVYPRIVDDFVSEHWVPSNGLRCYNSGMRASQLDIGGFLRGE